MATFSEIFSKFKTLPTVKVKVTGTDASFILASAEAWGKSYTKTREKLIESGVIKDTVDITKNNKLIVEKNKEISISNDTEVSNDFMLGSAQNDVDFFIDNILMGWEGITDDSGRVIPFTKDSAKAFFDPEKKETQKLVSRLIITASQEENFEDKEVNDTVKK